MENAVKNTDLFKQARSLHFPIGKYVLFGSAPLAVRGLRESHDIDILVNEDLWNDLKQRSEWIAGTTHLGSEQLTLGDVDVVREWAPGTWDVDSLIQNAELIDGLPFARLEDVLTWKALRGKEKDLSDIELIKTFLNQQ